MPLFGGGEQKGPALRLREPALADRCSQGAVSE